jgi:hypothetical protein
VLLCSVMGYGRRSEEVRDVWLLPRKHEAGLRFRTRVLRVSRSLLPTPPHVLSTRSLHANRLVQTVTLHAILSYIISQPRVITTSSHTIPYRSCQHAQQLISLLTAQLNIACHACHSKLNIINTAAPGRMYPPLSPTAGAQPSSP